MKDYKIILIRDENVSPALDRELRDLLVLCFPETAPIFSRQRFYQEPPQLRWCVYNDGTLVAHTALHLKKLKTDAGIFDMGGIAEVCVHPDYRGQGLVKVLMKKCDGYLREHSIPFAMLFGETKVYSSSGYKPAVNKIRFFDPQTEQWKVQPHPHAHYKELGVTNWPDGVVDICGPMF